MDKKEKDYIFHQLEKISIEIIADESQLHKELVNWKI